MLGTMQSYVGKSLSSMIQSPIGRYLTGHTYELVTAEDPDKEVVFTKFVEESRKSEKGVGEFFIGLRWIAEIKFYMFVKPNDPNKTIAELANYQDPAARAPFDPLLALLGPFVINKLDHGEVRAEREDIFKIIGAQNIFELTNEIFEKTFSSWDKEKTISHQIDAACIEAVTKILYKIELTPEEIDSLVECVEEAEKVVFNAHKIPEDEYNQLSSKFQALNDKLTEKYIEKIKAADKTYYEFRQENNPEKQAKDLNLFKILIVVGNLTALLKGMTVVLAEQDNDFLKKLKMELADKGDGDASSSLYELCEKSPFLHKLYLEGLRFFSPQGPLVRESSLPGQVGEYKISTNSRLISFLRAILPEKIKKRIPANAILIAPLYEMLHEPAEWDDPEVFNPNRKELDPNDPKYHPLNSYPFLPFSKGPRMCPASRSFIKKMFKAGLFSLARYKLKLTDKGEQHLETMELHAKVPRLYCDYYAKVKRDLQSQAKNQNENENEVSESVDEKHEVLESVRLSRSA